MSLEKSPVPSSPAPTDLIDSLPQFPNESAFQNTSGRLSDSNELSTPSSTSTLTRHPKLRLRLASSFFAYFLCGWGDGFTGTIMPYLKAEYQLNYTVLSLLFVASTVGFGIGTVTVERVIDFLSRTNVSATRPSMLSPWRLLRVKHHPNTPATIRSPTQARLLTLVYACLLHSTFFVLMAVKKGFPAMFVAYVFAAIGRGFITAVMNLYVSQTPGQQLGALLGFWSLGSLIAPLVCQSVIAAGVPWTHFYWGSFVVVGINFALVVVAFYPTRDEWAFDMQCAGDSSPESIKKDEIVDQLAHPTLENSRYVLSRALKQHYLWAFCFYNFLYYGAETAAQGYMATFLLQARNADPNMAGYVTSGFWGGATLARFAWGFTEPRLNYTQRKYTLQACLGLGVAMYAVIWAVNSDIVGYVCFSFVGLAFGIMYPATMALSNLVLPEEFSMVAMAMISWMASFGGGVFPLIIGSVVNSQGGIYYIYIGFALVTSMFLLLACFPSRRPTTAMTVV